MGGDGACRLRTIDTSDGFAACAPRAESSVTRRQQLCNI